MLQNIALVAISLIVGSFLAFSPALSASRRWKATLTPLASIMGSGFLVSAPLLAGVVGIMALPSMAALLVFAFAVGGAVRFNIRHFEPIEDDHGVPQGLGELSRIVLAGAYFISVSYYLQLLAEFSLGELGIDDPIAAHGIASGLLLVIGGVGMWRGLSVLESLEKYAVSLNLGVIASLLVGLLWFNGSALAAGTWALPDIDSTVDLHDARVLLGLLIVVQGFETSRYLGAEHPAEERVETMRLAQLISSGVYLLFVGLATILFQKGMGADVTAIIDMVRPVASVLPLLLVIAAIGSQFSAAVADNSGAGGLLGELTHHRFPARASYGFIFVVALVITWETDVNEIISYASRAFALFYALQCLIATLVAWQDDDIPRWRAFAYGALTLACATVFAFGVPSGG